MPNFVSISEGFLGGSTPKIAISYTLYFFERPLQQFCTTVQTVIQRLHVGKASGPDDLSSEHLIYAQFCTPSSRCSVVQSVSYYGQNYNAHCSAVSLR